MFEAVIYKATVAGGVYELHGGFRCSSLEQSVRLDREGVRADLVTTLAGVLRVEPDRLKVRFSDECRICKGVMTGTSWGGSLVCADPACGDGEMPQAEVARLMKRFPHADGELAGDYMARLDREWRSGR